MTILERFVNGVSRSPVGILDLPNIVKVFALPIGMASLVRAATQVFGLKQMIRVSVQKSSTKERERD